MDQDTSNTQQEYLTYLSYEMRMPLDSIMGLAELSKIRIDDKEQVKENLDRILALGEHLQRLFEDIQEVKRIMLGQIRIQEKRFSIAELVHNMFSIVHASVTKKEITFRVDCQKLENEFVIGDGLRLNSILSSLIGNSIRNTPIGGRIDVFISQHESNDKDKGIFQFDITDTGGGISPELVEKMMEPEWRTSDEISTNLEAVDMSLYVARLLTEFMGGNIKVLDSDSGAKIRISLPLKISQDDSHNSLVQTVKGRRAIIVDPDSRSASRIDRLLSKLGFECIKASEAREALLEIERAYARREVYDLVVVDWLLPDMACHDFLEKIDYIHRGQNPKCIVIGYNTDSVKDSLLLLGEAINVLEKPVFLSNFITSLGVLYGAEELRNRGREGYSFRGKRVLLVDDYELTLKVFTELLENVDVKVEQAKSGGEAIKKVYNSKEGYYDMIFMDIQMPKMDGYEATDKIRNMDREDVKNIPIFAMTANALDRDIELAKEHKMNGHIAKPVNMHKVYDIMGKCFSGR